MARVSPLRVCGTVAAFVLALLMLTPAAFAEETDDDASGCPSAAGGADARAGGSQGCAGGGSSASTSETDVKECHPYC